MKQAVLLSVLVAAIASPMAACTYKCTYNQDCYFCGPGGRLDTCSVDCNVCWGFRCIGGGGSLASGEAGESPSLFELEANDPLQLLHRFTTDRLGEAIHPAVARAFDGFWRWYGALFKPQHDPLNMAGGVAIDGKPHETTLEVRQRGATQVYTLSIDGFAKVVVAAHPPADGRIELEFEAQFEGEKRVRAGSLVAEAE